MELDVELKEIYNEKNKYFEENINKIKKINEKYKLIAKYCNELEPTLTVKQHELFLKVEKVFEDEKEREKEYISQKCMEGILFIISHKNLELQYYHNYKIITNTINN